MPNGCNIYGPESKLGETCCNEHDRHYNKGDISKREADMKLYRCVKNAGYPVKAAAMLAALTVGGWPLWLYYRNRSKRND